MLGGGYDEQYFACLVLNSLEDLTEHFVICSHNLPAQTDAVIPHRRKAEVRCGIAFVSLQIRMHLFLHVLISSPL